MEVTTKLGAMSRMSPGKFNTLKSNIYPTSITTLYNIMGYQMDDRPIRTQKYPPNMMNPLHMDPARKLQLVSVRRTG